MSRYLLGRWESRSGKHWVNCYGNGDSSFDYLAPDAVGCLGVMSEAAALVAMQGKVDAGYFQPDNAKTPMQLVHGVAFAS